MRGHEAALETIRRGWDGGIEGRPLTVILQKLLTMNLGCVLKNFFVLLCDEAKPREKVAIEVPHDNEGSCLVQKIRRHKIQQD